MPDHDFSPGLLSGSEIGYAQITAPVNITDTSEATGTAIITAGPFYFDGHLVIAEVFCGSILCDTGAASDVTIVAMFEGSTEVIRFAVLRSLSTATRNSMPLLATYRFTPSAGYHTYKIAASVTATTGTPVWNAGAGGTADYPPSYLRFIKV